MKHGGCSLAPLGTFEGKVPEAAMKLVAERRGGDQGRQLHRRDRRQRAACPAEGGGVDAPVVLRLDGITKRFGDAARQRRHRLRAAPGRGDRAARRERRRQDHADEHPLRPLRRRCGHGRGRWARRCRPATRGRRSTAGVGMVHQHFTLADNLTVLENIVLGTRPLWQPAASGAARRGRGSRDLAAALRARGRPGRAGRRPRGRRSASGWRSSRRSTATRAS